ncbi:MAG: hypothetical protein PQJ60_05380 [Spirochaetales bacterium]|nr:hypothetical protein [Spirochaetales bacterium]
MNIIITLFFVLFCVSCGGTPSGESLLSSGDNTPPVLLDYSVESAGELVLYFDEEVTVDGDTVSREPEGDITWEADGEGGLTLSFLPVCSAGSQNLLSLDVSDGEGNTNWFLLEFYAPNEDQPALLINEVSPNGTSSRPDMVEFFVESGGNTAGMALFLGTENEWSACYEFPEMDLAAGEYIIFHCRPEGGEGEISETGEDLSLSTGTRSEEGVRDLWPEEDMNLSGGSGILSLMTLPIKGQVMDRMIYTNRTGDPDDEYGGWTSSLWTQIEDLISQAEEERGWIISGDTLYPEEAVWSDDTTSTRTLCRSSLSADGDSGDDWHTGPTGGCSFGYANTDESYEP